MSYTTVLRFIIRRLIITVPTILVVITIVWGLIKLAPRSFYSALLMSN